MPTRRDVVMVASRALSIPGAQPGAREARVARYIDFVLYSGSEHAPEIQNQRCEAMDWLRGRRRDRTRKHEGYATPVLIEDLTVFAFYKSRAGMVDALEYKGNAYLKEFPACGRPEHRNWRG